MHATGRAGVVIAKVAATGGLIAIIKDAPDALKRKLDDIASLLGKLKGKLRNGSLSDVLEKDLANEDFFKALDADNELVSDWEALSGHSTLRLKPDLLQKAKKVLAQGHVSLEEVQEILRVNAGLGSRASAVTDLLDDLDYFALYKDKAGFGDVIAGLKKDWNGAGADGANWVIAALRKEGADVFPPGSTSFEVSFPSLGRKYDAVVGVQGARNAKYYEFKSYSNVPPNDFATQFVKDLNNEDIIDLNQLKWYFDAAKNPVNFEAGMKAAIESMDMASVTAETLQKFGVPNRPALKTKLVNEFNSIFYLK